MTKYVLGFAFNPSGAAVLIRKDHPPWQAGKLNGVGGKVNPDEEPIDAMVREFREEAGVATGTQDWWFFARMVGHDWDCYCYAAVDIAGAKTMTAEPIELHAASMIPLRQDLVENLKWLVPLARDGAVDGAEVKYK